MNSMLLAKSCAIIPAAGQGQRMGGQGNKLLLKLAGAPVLLFVLRTFNDCPYITEIVIPAAENDIPEIEKLVHENRIDKVKAIVRGGKERQDSVFEALKAVSTPIKRVIIHDGARPLLSLQQLTDFMVQSIPFEAAAMGVTPKDTIKVTDKESWVVQTLVRDELRAIQTPQSFDRILLEKVHMLAREQNYYTTDDSALCEWQGYKVKILPGSYENIKVTTPEDMLLAEMILQRRQNEPPTVYKEVKP